MYAEESSGEPHHGFGNGALAGPSQGRITNAHLDLEERLRRAHHLEERPDKHPWTQHLSTGLLPFNLPPPHPPGPSRGHTRRLSDSTWSMYPLAPLSGPAYTPPAQHNSSAESTPRLPPRPETPLQPIMTVTPGQALDTEDKRQRNTLASAKFRAKRKKHMENISKRIEELEGEQTSLTRDVAELKQENKFLREMVELKYGLDVGDQPSSSSNQDPKAGGDGRDDHPPLPQPPPPPSTNTFQSQRYR
ncbi:hypothetical protein DB88DRAFT_493527 [Papiliotrema laurentii]|uniref:BZIP domain-containing protein n=1 Tax=Papiliotrema laurentii TaxID=5418 RepID=A0AAD9CWW0_PAPLA|nr:hypothetical protein DB88DRAFT_493527 [Papiliotrema laurentii]